MSSHLAEKSREKIMDWCFMSFSTIFESRHVKTNKTSAPTEDSDQSGHLPSLIRVFAVHMMKAWVLSYPLSTQQILWLDWADAQADLSLHWAQSHFVGFVMLWLILVISGQQRMTTSMKALRNEVPLRFGQTFISNKIQTLDPWSKVRNTIKLPSYINTSHRLAESGFLCK